MMSALRRWVMVALENSKEALELHSLIEDVANI